MRITEATDTLRKLSQAELKKHKKLILACATFLAEYYGYEVREPVEEIEVNYRNVKGKSITQPYIDLKWKQNFLEKPTKILNERELTESQTVQQHSDSGNITGKDNRYSEATKRYAPYFTKVTSIVYSCKSVWQRLTGYVLPKVQRGTRVLPESGNNRN